MNSIANMQADWGIVEKGYKAHVLGEAPHKFKDAKTAVKTLRVRTPCMQSPCLEAWEAFQ